MGVLRSAASLASDVEGLRRALDTTVGERYRIEVRLRRQDLQRCPASDVDPDS